MGLWRHGFRTHAGFKIFFFFQLQAVLLSLSLPQFDLSFRYSQTLKKYHPFQGVLLWYFMSAYSTSLNVNSPYPFQNRPSSLKDSFWCELLMDCRHTRHMSRTLHTNPPFGIGVVGLCGRSVTWNGSISAHITEHIPYKAAASVYSLPPVRCWHPVAALYLRQYGGWCSLFPCEPRYARWLEHLCQWLRGQMEQQRTFWRGYGN